MIRRFIIGLSISVACYGASAENGANLFDGTKSFENGAVACVACHNVNSSAVISGGTLAMDLTAMGGAIEYTLTSTESMTSPVMQKAYKGKLPTAAEIADLDAFLMSAGAEEGGKATNSNFAVMAVAGAVIAFIILSLLGSRRKKQSVNQELFDRQMKSSQSSHWRDS